MPTDQTHESLTNDDLWELLFQRDMRWGYLKAWATAQPENVSRETLLDMLWGLEGTYFEGRPDEGLLADESAKHSQQ